MQHSPPHAPPPRRPALLNELGQQQTPPDGPEAFQILGSGPRIIVLSLGPNPDVPAGLVRGLVKNQKAAPQVIYADCPEFAAQMTKNAPRTPPPGWRQVDAPEAMRLIRNSPGAAGATFILYLPGLRLFPSFFGPLFGAVWAARASMPTEGNPGIGADAYAAKPRDGRAIRSVTLAGSERDLLHRELRLAFAAEGIRVKCWNPEETRAIPDPAYSAAPAAVQNPNRTAAPAGPAFPPEDSLGDLFLSVNFKGLDPLGAVYHYLRARDVVVAVWCVDNPWHLLSGLRSPYWRELPLFVTDHSFIPGLKAHGARRACHLPLAACPELFAHEENAVWPEADFLKKLAPLAFVGRTAFPGRDKFFAAQRLPEALHEALQSLETGGRPDFLYWAETLGISKLWPGQEARRAGLAAEECARRRRTLCVGAAAREMRSQTAENPPAPGITVFGDEAWREELADIPPQCLDLRGTLDYYTELPALYRAASLVLNVTSLLLPAGLNQRHFDVWLADGAQICDPSPGLDVFPQDLVRPLLFDKPADIPARAADLCSDPTRLRALKRDWKGLILAEHTYARRVRSILDAVE